jgi:ABC-2 type transport system ATP-binding protein
MEMVLKTDNLSKWYGNILGISEISLELPKGVHGLLGPNGAGKSTFLKVVSGQLKPNLGEVKVFDQRVFNNPDLFHKIGFCTEIDCYYRGITGWEFILFLTRLKGYDRSRLDEKAMTAFERVGLTAARDKLISTYSMGMRQRLRIAASIIHEPDLLILDEPLKGVDPLWRVKIIDLVKEYKKNKKTVIVSSHILPEIEAMTNNITLIHQGKIFAHGDIQEIRNLIDTHPHQISVVCEKPRDLARLLIKEDNIMNISLDDQNKSCVFQTTHRDHFFNKLMKEIVTRDIQIKEITSPDDNLQAVFDYLIGR